MADFIHVIGPNLFWVIVAPCAMIYGIVAVVSCEWGKAARARVEAGLKHEMIARGMSAEEIGEVLAASSRRKKGGPAAWDEAPVASEAAVWKDEEFRRVLVLRHGAGQYYVHYVGEDMSQNEWVPSDRVRIAAEGLATADRPNGKPWPREVEV